MPQIWPFVLPTLWRKPTVIFIRTVSAIVFSVAFIGCPNIIPICTQEQVLTFKTFTWSERIGRPKNLIEIKNGKSHPGWVLIDIQSFSALIQRFLRFQRCSELNQPTLILTSLVITDSVMNISEHLWFSAEHYWQAANSQRPWKKPKKCFFFNIDAEETRNQKFQNNF